MRFSLFLFPRGGGVYTLQNARGGSGGNFSEKSLRRTAGDFQKKRERIFGHTADTAAWSHKKNFFGIDLKIPLDKGKFVWYPCITQIVQRTACVLFSAAIVLFR